MAQEILLSMLEDPYIVICTHSFPSDGQPATGDDLMIKVLVTGFVNESWLVGQVADRVGIFPASHVVEAASTGKRGCMRAIACYDFLPEYEDEMELRVGDEILVTGQCEDQDQWWVGIKTRLDTDDDGNVSAVSGTFPSNFVKVVEEGPYFVVDNDGTVDINAVTAASAPVPQIDKSADNGINGLLAELELKITNERKAIEGIQLLQAMDGDKLNKKKKRELEEQLKVCYGRLTELEMQHKELSAIAMGKTKRKSNASDVVHRILSLRKKIQHEVKQMQGAEVLMQLAQSSPSMALMGAVVASQYSDAKAKCEKLTNEKRDLELELMECRPECVYARTNFPYTPQGNGVKSAWLHTDDEELELEDQDLIVVKNKDEDPDWYKHCGIDVVIIRWYGCSLLDLNGQSGWFPSSYVTIVTPDTVGALSPRNEHVKQPAKTAEPASTSPVLVGKSEPAPPKPAPVRKDDKQKKEEPAAVRPLPVAPVKPVIAPKPEKSPPIADEDKPRVPEKPVVITLKGNKPQRPGETNKPETNKTESSKSNVTASAPQRPKPLETDQPRTRVSDNKDQAMGAKPRVDTKVVSPSSSNSPKGKRPTQEVRLSVQKPGNHGHTKTVGSSEPHKSSSKTVAVIEPEDSSDPRFTALVEELKLWKEKYAMSQDELRLTKVKLTNTVQRVESLELEIEKLRALNEVNRTKLRNEEAELMGVKQQLAVEMELRASLMNEAIRPAPGRANTLRAPSMPLPRTPSRIYKKSPVS